jgi:hypothetical protein
MDSEGRLHPGQRRSHTTMMTTPDPVRPRRPLRYALALLLAASLQAQQAAQTGPQQLTLAGLRSVQAGGQPAGQIDAVRTDAQGNLYLLVDQKDGVRVLKTDPTASTLLAQTVLGAHGDIGTALTLDPSGNLYITGTTTSGAMTSTTGAAFPSVPDTSTNSFVAKLSPALATLFVTFTGGARMAATGIAATADAVFITGSSFAATVPVTPAAIIQTSAYLSTQNGFVEKFSASGTTLLYATYLSGANGTTAPAAIAADASDNAYIAGTTSSPGYPTLAAIVPAALGATSGFLTKLTPAGDGITFSTYLPGAGITSLALDASAQDLLLSGSIALGQFPVATVSSPIAATPYQVLLRMALDGSSVLASTLLAAGTQSFVTPSFAGTTWIDGSLSTPLLPLAPLAGFGTGFAVRVNAQNTVDQTARFGGLAASSAGSASAPVAFTSVTVDPTGQPIFAGGLTPSTSSSLLATQTFDLPLHNAPTAALPSTVHDAVPAAASCAGSLCPGAAAYLARLAATAAASLALSVDDAPNLTLRNLGTTQATGLTLAATGFTYATNCGTTLAAASECSIALNGTGPGTLTVQATNAAAQTAAIPTLTAAATPVFFSPKELDFGIGTSSGTSTRTVTVTNLTQQSQTFTSALDSSAHTTLPYTFAETASDCTLAATATKLLAPGGVCHITIGFTPSSLPANDGIVTANWSIGTRDVALTAFAQAAPLSLSATEIDFGTQFTNGLRLPRYLYLSNSSATAIPHATVALPAASPFSATDRCPATLEPGTVCQIQLTYLGTHAPASDATTLALDQGLSVLVTGETLPQPGVTGASVNPNLTVSTSTIAFANAVPVTGVSSTTQTVTIRNAGPSAFALTLALTGDFTDSSGCGASLAAGASCTVLLTFAPSQPGTRQGLLAVTAGAGSAPSYISLGGVGTPILPANNGTLDFGAVIAGQPATQWYKVAQPFSTLTATTTGPWLAVLVEDIGYGHGQPPTTAFSASATGTCNNCYLGLQLKPATAGPQTGTVTLTSSPAGNPYVLALTGTGLPLTGLLLTPLSQDFGPVPVNSASTVALFTATNLVPGGASIALATPTVTGDFALSNAATGATPCGGTLSYTASCTVQIAFAPTAVGQRTGTLTLQTAGQTATAVLTGYGAPDPGLALAPNALVFNNIPAGTSTQQTVTLTNTTGTSIQIGAPTTSANFTAATGCATLAPAAGCAIVVTFTPRPAPSRARCSSRSPPAAAASRCSRPTPSHSPGPTPSRTPASRSSPARRSTARRPPARPASPASSPSTTSPSSP